MQSNKQIKILKSISDYCLKLNINKLIENKSEVLIVLIPFTTYDIRPTLSVFYQ